ncbi:MAG: hypothetical protein OEX02_09160 [Cyclobacteriaceae bacterium]|nr:hypothetical protein [Cyclobacteriaceae bacterium]
MKYNLFNSTFIMLLAAFMLFSCGEKEKVSPNQNTLKLDGSAFDVSVATIVGVTISGDGHAAVTLASGSETQTNTLSLDFEYSIHNSMTGKYAFPAQPDYRLLDDWLSNYTTFDGTNMTSTNLQEGTLEIYHNGDTNYTVIIDITMVDGKVFSGTYTGEFTVAINNG